MSVLVIDLYFEADGTRNVSACKREQMDDREMCIFFNAIDIDKSEKDGGQYKK